MYAKGVPASKLTSFYTLQDINIRPNLLRHSMCSYCIVYPRISISHYMCFKLIDRIKSYLTNRKLYVKLGSLISEQFGATSAREPSRVADVHHIYQRRTSVKDP